MLFLGSGRRCSFRRPRHLTPDAEGARSQQTVLNSAEQMSADTKEIEVLHLSEAEAEPVVQPDGVTDDCWGKSIPTITGRPACHRPTLSPAAST